MDRKDTLVSTENDKNKEELLIRTALRKCGYPKWIFQMVKQDQRNKELRAKKTNKKSTSDQSDGGLVVIPYVGRLSEATERIDRKYGISTAVKPYKTLRNLLVHPKDKRTVGQTGESVYKIPCDNCSSMYIGETGRSYGKRQEEHRKEVESISNRTLTRADRKDLAKETNKSVITDHVAKPNNVIDWSGATLLDRESQRVNRKRKTTYERILVTRSSSTSCDHMPDEVRRWRTETSQLGTDFCVRLFYMNILS